MTPSLGAAIVAWSLACGGAPPDAPRGAVRPADPAFAMGPIVLTAPFEAIGLPPDAPWNHGKTETPFDGKAPNDLWVTYDHLPEQTPVMARDAWKAAALAGGLTLVREGTIGDKASATLKRPGAELRIDAWRNARWLIVDLAWRDKELVVEGWATDPFCPAGTRPRPRELERDWKVTRRCYRVGTELVLHGPYARLEAGEVVERGQYADGEKTGDWVSKVVDADATWERTARYADARGLEQEVYRRDGLEFARFTYGAGGVPEGRWTWKDAAGQVTHQVEMRAGAPLGITLKPTSIPSKLAVSAKENQLEVLDVDPDRGLIAVKTWTEADGHNGGVDCGYAGMEPRPYEGVVLSVVEVGQPEPTSWTVYRAAATEAECMPHAASAAALGDARAHIERLGLRLDRKPVWTTATETGGSDAALALGGRTVRLEVERRRGEIDVLDVLAQAHRVDEERGLVIGNWSIDGEPQLPLTVTHGRSYGGAGDITLVGGFEGQQKVLLVFRLDVIPWGSDWAFVSIDRT